jgi:regulator of sirC expression with transglutaminase-like and TPR domain
LTRSSPDTIRERFAELARLPDERIDLAVGALLISGEEYPGLDLRVWLARLDRMAAEVRPRLGGARDELQRLELLTGYLYGEYGLRGNAEAYYDPRNSYLNEVLERRLGIPVTLAIVGIEVGRRAGVPLEGVGFPGHFLLRHALHPQILLDPFDAGRLLTIEDCEALLLRMSGGAAGFQPSFLHPVGARQILVRMLTNLKGIHAARGELDKAIAAVDRILLLTPEDAPQLRDRGLLHIRRGDFAAGIADLESFLEQETAAPEHDEMLALLEEAKRRLQMVN